jgi:hypothetical protein
LESRKRKNNGKITRGGRSSFRKKKITLKIITAKYNLKLKNVTILTGAINVGD